MRFNIMANINIRIDENVKKKAEAIFNELGLTATAAINLFYIQVIRTKSIPFFLKADEPNKTTLSAMKEVEEMEKGSKKADTYHNVDELMEDLLK